MHISVNERWDRRIAYYDDKNFKFISQEIISDFEILYDNSPKPHSKYKSDRIPALNIALCFAGLYKNYNNNESFIDAALAFIKKYGMMGINREKLGLLYRESVSGYSESLFEWKKEVSEMYNVFKKISSLNEKYSDKILNTDSALTEIQFTINDHLTNIHPYLILDYTKNDFFLRPMIRTFNLLGSMYFAIFQALPDYIVFAICVNEGCGAPFICPPRKKIKDKCPDCVISERNKRKNDNRRSEPLNVFKENIGERVRYHTTQSLSIPVKKVYILKDWYDSILKEPNSNILDKEKWMEDKDKEFYEILKSIKKEV